MRLKYIFTAICLMISFSSIAQTWSNFNNFGMQVSSTGKVRFLPTSGSGNVPIALSDSLKSKASVFDVEYSPLDPAVSVTADGSYNAFPGLARLTSGKILLVYRKGVTHLTFDGDIILKTSIDNGRTWSSENVIISGVSGDDFRDPSLTVLGNGDILMSYFNRITSTNLTVYTVKSTDGGITWGTPVALSGYTDYAAVSAPAIRLSNGDLLLPTYGKSSSNGLTQVYKSTNNGASWSVFSNITTDAFIPNLLYTEVNLGIMPNGNILATLRKDNGQICTSISTNSGSTWSTVTERFAGLSRAGINILGNKIILNYRSSTAPNTSNAAFRYSIDNSTTFSTEVGANSPSSLNQDEYSSLVYLGGKTFGYAYGLENSTSTAATMNFRYLKDPLSFGYIPSLNLDGVIVSGSTKAVGGVATNTISGLGTDVTMTTNASSTAIGLKFRTSQTDRLSILGNGNILLRGATDDGTNFNSVGTGKFSGNLTSANVLVSGATGVNRGYFWQTNGSIRSGLLIDNSSESGSNAGSNIVWNSYSDAGALLGTFITGNRANQIINFTKSPTSSVDAANNNELARFGQMQAAVALKASVYRYTASGTGSATTIIIPHGLSGMSTSSGAIPIARNAASSGIQYATMDATNISIFYNVAPVSGTNNLSYEIAIRQ